MSILILLMQVNHNLEVGWIHNFWNKKHETSIMGGDEFPAT